MFVQLTGERDNLTVIVMGEPLAGRLDGSYLLPGRLVKALKPEDLPPDIPFMLEGSLPSGYGFYREDSVVFRREKDPGSMWISVTSTYQAQEWDGLFPLEATLLARKQVLDQHKEFVAVEYEPGDEASTIRYEFGLAPKEPIDLESALEAICDTVFEVEARGNARLWPRAGGQFGEL
ncbi:hypothetical protein [Brevibacillus choshinensis]|uniref:Phage tail protein n=1 Tax=Brevibacillus choshinensis TaxID=54911 RepID=A0ABX7FWX4_BRECH|nr:hypothetical protein [Brevibacillus choshinensis]QRG70015.1 hypothetical protein JNE38_13350 [Brevibacillus choshinensis]